MFSRERRAGVSPKAARWAEALPAGALPLGGSRLRIRGLELAAQLALPPRLRLGGEHRRDLHLHVDLGQRRWLRLDGAALARDPLVELDLPIEAGDHLHHPSEPLQAEGGRS